MTWCMHRTNIYLDDEQCEMLDLGDDLIAATTLVRGLELATLNVEHFPMFNGLQAPFRLTVPVE